MSAFEEAHAACSCRHMDGHRLDCRIGCDGKVGSGTCRCAVPDRSPLACLWPGHDAIRRAVQAAEEAMRERAWKAADDYNDHICFTKSICGKLECKIREAIGALPLTGESHE